MQQLSLPFRLALGAMIVAGALWTLVLKPKDAATPATTPVAAPVAPGVAGLTRSSNGAKAAVDKANSAAASREQAANAVDPNTASAPTSPAATAATPATADATAAKPATKTAKPAAPVKAAKPAPGSLESFVAGAGPAKSLVRALADGKVVMMVFKNRSSDSAAVERAARKVAAGAGGRIRLRVTNIGNVGKYAVFTAKTPIGQAPTTLIIGPKKTARVIVGFTTTAEIGQAAHEQGTGTSRIAAHRAAAQRRTRRAARAAAARDRIVCKGHGASCVSYFTKVNRACTKLSLGSYDRGFAASAAGGTVVSNLRNEARLERALTVRVASIAPPGGFSASHRILVRARRADASVLDVLVSRVTALAPAQRTKAKLNGLIGDLAARPSVKRRGAALTRLGYGACA